MRLGAWDLSVAPYALRSERLLFPRPLSPLSPNSQATVPHATHYPRPKFAPRFAPCLFAPHLRHIPNPRLGAILRRAQRGAKSCVGLFIPYCRTTPSPAFQKQVLCLPHQVSLVPKGFRGPARGRSPVGRPRLLPPYDSPLQCLAPIPTLSSFLHSHHTCPW